MKTKIISIDAETNGLWGQAFAIAAVLYENGVEKSTFLGRCPIKDQVNEWVEKNVLPQITKIQETHNSYNSLLKAFSEFYLENKKDADVIVHMGLPVEARLFIDAHTLGFIGDWDAPYPLIDISTIQQIGTSVDTYNKKHGIIVPPCEGGTHNPLYDARATVLAYMYCYGKRGSGSRNGSGSQICEACGSSNTREVYSNHSAFFACQDCGHANRAYTGG